MIDSWHEYPKVYALGHAAIRELLLDDVIVQEKVDGSQFSFGRFNGELKARSRRQQIVPEAPIALFDAAVRTAHLLDLHDGWTYRAEYLAKPRHNGLKYSRVPVQHLIVFDINDGQEAYLPWSDVEAESHRIGLECVPCFHCGRIESADEVRGFLERESILGGAKIEGVVVKNHSRFGRDGKVLMGKFVSEAFKEAHAMHWKQDNPQKADVVEAVIEALRTDARWQKAIQHLAERGELKGEPCDIGPVLKELQRDTREECTEQIKDALFAWAWPRVSRGVIHGFPEWYKQFLLDKQFSSNEVS